MGDSDTMGDSVRDVVVLGWWRPTQSRVSYVELLMRELNLGLAEAKKLLDEHLTTAKPTVIPIRPASRASAVAFEIDALGAEVIVLSGHAGADGQAAANLELEMATRSVHELLAAPHAKRDALVAAASALCAHLRPQR